VIQLAGNRVEVSGALTLDTATAVLRAGEDALATVLAQSDTAVFDLAQVTAVDSAALAVVFAWVRRAEALERRITLTNPPQGLLSLASVYGASELLPLA
jgi:phospholipid transport system transporter-binding protein